MANLGQVDCAGGSLWHTFAPPAGESFRAILAFLMQNVKSEGRKSPTKWAEQDWVNPEMLEKKVGAKYTA